MHSVFAVTIKVLLLLALPLLLVLPVTRVTIFEAGVKLNLASILVLLL